MLSALNLEDGSAKRVFEKIDANAETFKSAIRQQYKDALSSIGIDAADEVNPEPVRTNKVFVNSQPSGQELIKSLYEFKKKNKGRPLSGADVISVASKMEHGVVARAFNAMGVDSEKLAFLINQELQS